MTYSDKPNPLATFLRRSPAQTASSSVALDVCPQCKRAVTLHCFNCGGNSITSYHCHEHGDVVPMRSAIVNCW